MRHASRCYGGQLARSSARRVTHRYFWDRPRVFSDPPRRAATGGVSAPGRNAVVLVKRKTRAAAVAFLPRRLSVPGDFGIDGRVTTVRGHMRLCRVAVWRKPHSP